MELKELQNRLNNAQTKLEKALARQAKWFKLLDYKSFQFVDKTSTEVFQAWKNGVLTFSQENAVIEYKNATYLVSDAQQLLAKYTIAVNKETANQQANSLNADVPAVKEFLQNWRTRAYEVYIADAKEYVVKYNEFKIKFPKYDNDHRIARNELRARFEHVMDMVNTYTGEVFTTRLNEMLDKEVIRKERNLIARVSKAVGTIKDASNLYIGNNMEINGFVVGTEGKAKVETITAGGYNIQRLHFRVLVNNIK
jgi:hypothetical protein